MKSADWLCVSGVACVGASLWAVSPALAGGALGLLLVVLGMAKRHADTKAALAKAEASKVSRGGSA